MGSFHNTKITYLELRMLAGAGLFYYILTNMIKKGVKITKESRNPYLWERI